MLRNAIPLLRGQSWVTLPTVSYRSVAVLMAGSALGVMVGIAIVGAAVMFGGDTVTSWLKL